MAKRGRRVNARKKTKARRARKGTRGLGRGLVELTGLRGSRLGVPGNERRKPGRTLPGKVGTELFGTKKRKKRKTKSKKKGRNMAATRGKRKKSRKSRKKNSSYKSKKRGVSASRKKRKKSKSRKSRKSKSRPRTLYGLRGKSLRAVAQSVPGEMAQDTNNPDKHTPIIGGYEALFAKQSGWAAMAGAITGHQVANVTASALYELGAALFNKESVVVKPDNFVVNMLSDFLTAGLLWEAGVRLKAENFGSYGAVVAATRSLNALATQHLTAPAMKAIKLTPASAGMNGLGAWHEYGYEGGGVGLYRESDSAPLSGMSLYREAEDAPLGVVRVPDGAMIGLGQDAGEMFEEGSDNGTLFG